MDTSSSPFQALKPSCIRLSKAGLELKAGRATPVDVADAQADVQRVLESIEASSPHVLDRKLADYIFFPLSHVLGQHSKLPSRALESCLRCVLILLRTAWRSHIEPKLGIQLLILLTILADPDASGERKSKRSEEFQIVVHECFADALKALLRTKDGCKELLAATNLPYLGAIVSGILDGVSNGPSQTVQLSALGALEAFIDAVDDREALSISFLPGIVSALQKVLKPKTSTPRSFKVLRKSLTILSTLLSRVLNDDVAADLEDLSINDENAAKKGHRVDKSWLTATAAQIKMVLATVMNLRSHSRNEVQEALFHFCIDMVRGCRNSLSDSIPFIIETALTLAAGEANDARRRLFINLLRNDDSLATMLEHSLYNWIISMPRLMQSPDDVKKQRLIAQISCSYQLLSELEVDMSRVGGILATHIRDSVATIFLEPAGKAVEEAVVHGTSDTEVALILANAQIQGWQSIISPRGTRTATLEDLAGFTSQLSTSTSPTTLLQEIIDSTFQSEGVLQTASFWVSLQMVRSALERDKDMNRFIDIQSDSQDATETALEDLYDFSLEIAKDSVFAQGHDWRVQALSLETIALEATQLGTDFQNELVEVLYPIIHLLGSRNGFIRQHAMTCLNIVASACEYQDAKELIISNVDYLVNAVSLQIDRFEITEQAPLVLLMMIKLTGPRLLPYLDDSVESMFGALEQYHGHTKLAEALFSVLLAIAEEGAKTEQLSITHGEDKASCLTACDPTTIGALATTIKEMKRKREEEDKIIEDIPRESFPRRPWKETGAEAKEHDLDSDLEAEDDEGLDPPPQTTSTDVDAKPPVPKVYTILLKISELTQHYLTSSSPSFRTMLLRLLDTAFPALAKHENSFLPLINKLWPVVVSRLEDQEGYVVASALETIGVMCRYAGSFMRSRIVELWGTLLKIARKRAGMDRRKQQNKTSARTRGVVIGTKLVVRSKEAAIAAAANSGYVEAPVRLLCEKMTKLLVAIIDHVEVSEDMFDEALELLVPFLDQSEVREALDRRNADAVWLVLQRLRGPAEAMGQSEAGFLAKVRVIEEVDGQEDVDFDEDALFPPLR